MILSPAVAVGIVDGFEIVYIDHRDNNLDVRVLSPDRIRLFREPNRFLPLRAHGIAFETQLIPDIVCDEPGVFFILAG
jgi:hypothetical protein